MVFDVRRLDVVINVVSLSGRQMQRPPEEERPGADVLKLLQPYFKNVHNKLERFSLASLSRIV